MKYTNIPSEPERIFMAIIEKYSIPLEYTGNGKYIIHGFCPDFMNIKRKKIVEIFGNYYHFKKRVANRDKIRLKTYEANGYDCIVIWASELKNINLVLTKLSILFPGEYKKWKIKED